ncbi:MAG: THUMP domain-containing protein, partial [Candidatus Aminicenantes bacterium]|nr:THUMP domain-containing protein [Candidatus Aminicenantes bacterium]
MFAYQQDGRFFAQTARGLAELASAELAELGARDIEDGGGGLYFSADAAGLYRVNYCSRLVSRVLAPLAEFPCPAEQTLYDSAQAIEWERILSPDRTFAVFASVADSVITHAHYAALRVKDAIADYFRAKNMFANMDRESQAGHFMPFEKLKKLSEVLFAVKEDMHLLFKRLIDPAMLR